MTTSHWLIVLPEFIVYLYNGYVYWRIHLLFMTYFTIKANYNCPGLLLRVIAPALVYPLLTCYNGVDK